MACLLVFRGDGVKGSIHKQITGNAVKFAKESSIKNKDQDQTDVNNCRIFASLLLFVIGSALYSIMSVEDYRWANKLRTYLEFLDPIASSKGLVAVSLSPSLGGGNLS